MDGAQAALSCSASSVAEATSKLAGHSGSCCRIRRREATARAGDSGRTENRTTSQWAGQRRHPKVGRLALAVPQAILTTMADQARSEAAVVVIPTGLGSQQFLVQRAEIGEIIDPGLGMTVTVH